MLSVYDLTCNGLRDGRGLREPLVLSWRLGSNHAGARQVAYRIVATSALDGALRWDTGRVESGDNEVAYAGEALMPGEECVWFVSVEDDAGEQDYGVPSTFGVARGEEEPQSLLGPQRMGFVWTSSERVNEELERTGAGERLDDVWWREVLGVCVAGDAVHVEPQPHHALADGLAFVQGSVLVSRGLMVVRWDRTAQGVDVRISLPPGMSRV